MEGILKQCENHIKKEWYRDFPDNLNKKDGRNKTSLYENKIVLKEVWNQNSDQPRTPHHH